MIKDFFIDCVFTWAGLDSTYVIFSNGRKICAVVDVDVVLPVVGECSFDAFPLPMLCRGLRFLRIASLRAG